jgi:hypothetical protein
MGYPAAMGRGSSGTDATRTRDLGDALAAFRRRDSSGITRRQKAVDSSSPSTGMGRLFFSAHRGVGAWRFGGTGGSWESPAQKYGAVCADRLAKKRTARTSDIFMGTINPAPITRESPLRQSVDWKTTAVGLSRLQILELKGYGATLLSSCRVD